ncbi:hypothetical protein MASR2M15_24830 [Anaerolineales bacterium]
MSASDFDPPLRLLSEFSQLLNGQEPRYVAPVEGREMWVAGETRSDKRITVIVAEYKKEVTFTTRSVCDYQTYRQRPLPEWARPFGDATLALIEADIPMQEGFYLAIAGNEPPGPRFRHALMLAFGTFVFKLNGMPGHQDQLMRIFKERFV